MSSFLQLTVERTEEKRQAVAKALLGWEKVVDAIGLAAAAGADKTTITPEKPIKIRHTAAAIAVEERLKKAGFRPTWTEHRPTVTGPAGDQLEIEWGR